MPEQREFRPAEQRALLKELWTQCLELGGLGFTLMKLYLQSRALMMQNFILTCRLHMWDAVFVYYKIQIFFIRLACGFPLGDCWPAEKSLPPIA